MQKKLDHSTAYRIVNFRDDIHVVPQDDSFEHIYDVNCPCCPFEDPKNKTEQLLGLAGSAVWVHKRIKQSRNELI